MTQFFLKTQTPSIELKAVATDGAGSKDSCLVGWKRVFASESQNLIEEWQSLIETAQETDKNIFTSEVVKNFVKDRILYIKDIQLVDENGKAVLKVSDTRTAQDNSPAWGESGNCLPWLLDLFLNSTPWWDTFLEGMLTSFTNISQDSSKN